MAKKFVMPDFQEIAQFVRSQQAQQHIENSERYIFRKEKLSPFEKKLKYSQISLISDTFSVITFFAKNLFLQNF